MSELARLDFAAMAQAAQERVALREVGSEGGSHQGASQFQERQRSPEISDTTKNKARQGHAEPEPLPYDFRALVRPLEDLRPAWRLREPGRGWCRAVFDRAPEVFADLVSYSIESWNEGSSDKPLGLLCQSAREQLEEWGAG